MKGIDGVVRLQLQAPFGKRGKTDQNLTDNQNDQIIGFTSTGGSNSFAGAYAFA